MGNINDFSLKICSISNSLDQENEELKDSKTLEISTKHLGKGRPYSGEVDASDGREDHVKEKRAIFRAFKQFLRLFS